MKLSVFQLSECRAVLAGSAAGRKFSSVLKAEVARFGPERTVVELDFSGISIATSSFLREALVSFRGTLRSSMPNFYLVLSNLGPDVREELSGLLDQMGEAFWIAERDGSVQSLRLIGRLEEKLNLALSLVEQNVEADASGLWEKTRLAEPIGVTAWNNRLAVLARMGLLFESRSGKHKRYSLVRLEKNGGTRSA